MRSLIFLACVLTLVRLVASENEGKSISHQWKPSPQSFYDALFYLLEFVRTVACLFGNLVSALYFLLHAIVIASCELISSIFSYVKHAIKLLEFIVVSAWSTGPQLLELLYSIMGSIFLGIEYVGKSINTFSTSVCNHLIPISKFLFYSIQTLLSAFGQNTLTLLNAIFWAISETFSTLIACSTAVCNQLIPISKSLLYNIQALLRVFGQNILTMLNAVFWAISETFSNLIMWSSSVCNQLIPFSKWMLCGIQALLCAIGQNTLIMLNTILWAISETFSTLITCSTSVINQLIPISKSLLYNIQVLLRVFGQNILTMLNAVFWAISETFSTLITWSSSVCNQLIPFSKWLLCGIQAFLCAIGQNTLTMLNAIFSAISETFSNLITCSTLVINQLIPISKSLCYNIQALLLVIGQKTLTMLNAIFWAISETSGTFITCSTSVYNQLIPISKSLYYNIQALLLVIGQNTLTMLNAIFWAISQMSGTLITCSTSVYNELIPFSKWLLYGIQALLCTIGKNMLTMLNAIFWVISETCGTLITCSTSVINQLIPISKSLWYNIQVLLRVFGQNILTMLNAVFWAISETFSTLIMCSSSVCNQLTFFSKWLLCGIQAFLFAFGEKILNVLNAIFWATRVIFSTLITELGRHYIKCIETLPNVASLALHYSLNVGRWTVVVLALVGFFLINCWVGVNVFSMTFELLQSSLHGVLAFFASFQVTSFPRQEKTTDEHEKPGHEPKDGRYLDLMEQLEREREQLERERKQLERDRDENLCVVCQTERKNIVLMPCRHMCNVQELLCSAFSHTKISKKDLSTLP